MRCQEGPIERICTVREAKKGRWMTTLPHRIDGKLASRGSQKKFPGKDLEDEVRVTSGPRSPFTADYHEK